MTKSERIRQANLQAIEAELEMLAPSCLAKCAAGRWGLFGQNSLADPEDRYWTWPEAKRLRGIAAEISAMLAENGETNAFCERFLSHCKPGGANMLGEPRLAADLLEEFWAGK